MNTFKPSRCLRFICLAGALLASSCAVLRESNKKYDTLYANYPLVTTHRFLSVSRTLGPYSLVFDRAVTRKEDLPNYNFLTGLLSDNSAISGGRYSFFKDKTKLSDVYIYARSTVKQAGGLQIGNTYKYIEVLDGTTDKKSELTSELNSDEILSVVQDKNTLRVLNFYDSDSLIKLLQGYAFELNGEKYGVLTFYQTPVLHELKSHAEIDPKLADTLNLYILAIYETKAQEDTK